MSKQAEILVKTLLEADEPSGESPKEFMRRRNVKSHGPPKPPKPVPYVPYVNVHANDAENWADWDDLEDWQRSAAKELEQVTDSLFSLESYEHELMELQGPNGSMYRVFRCDDTANSAAVAQVRDQLDSEPELFNQDWLTSFIDLEHLANQLRSDVEESDREWFNGSYPSYEDKRDELIEQDYLARDDFFTEDGDELEIDRGLEEKIDDAEEAYVEAMVKRKMDDPIGYLADIYGEEDATKEAMRIGGIDIEKAAEEAVSTDGAARFLASYDGETIEMPSGYVAFRS